MNRGKFVLLILFLVILSADFCKASDKCLRIEENRIASKQVCFSSSDTIYTIDKVIDLDGRILKLPDNCVLRFDGGVILNGTVIFNNTRIQDPCFRNVRFEGNIKNETFNISDYGAIAGSDMDCSVVINDLIKLQSSSIPSRSAKTIVIPNGTFYIDNPIVLWAGWEAPVTLQGNGNTSTLCQRRDNVNIIRLYENHYIKNLKLIYNNWQILENSGSVAIACQRSIFSLFENLTICKAKSAFGYIPLNDQKKGWNPTRIKDQCYVSCNFRNIRIYEFSGYAFDFSKEFPQGDSGSAFDNVYINSNDWLGRTTDNKSLGAIKGDNTVASMTQLNIEGSHYSSNLIDLSGMSRVSIQSLHIEGIKNMPIIIKNSIQSLANISMMDIQFCNFTVDNYVAFLSEDDALITIGNFCVRNDCKKNSNAILMTKRKTTNSHNITIEYSIDCLNFLK